ncbi:hypothetical protein NCER_101965 [Vairimorpha ceranae BRL01]|uniref:V-SNARE coiled-coil homology domain-containing protein n=1 Tax=Vairimorpha ceranae (strain BRL01) TaxID=578460 RepID=C4VB47_VAIC1|nr:hypothetical protein NCER_101965 [Vairimorpha ceranae BRL01]
MTIYYTLVRENKTKKIIGGEFSPQSETITIGKDILKEIRDISNNGNIAKIESALDQKFIFIVYLYEDILYSVIIDQYEKDNNVINYIHSLSQKLSEKEYKSYEFDNVIKEKSNEFNKDKTLKEIDDTKNILADSLNLIIQRRENINNISKLADRLTFETKEMHSSIKNMQFNNLVKEYGVYAVIGFIIFLFLYFILH